MKKEMVAYGVVHGRKNKMRQNDPPGENRLLATPVWIVRTLGSRNEFGLHYYTTFDIVAIIGRKQWGTKPQLVRNIFRITCICRDVVHPDINILSFC